MVVVVNNFVAFVQNQFNVHIGTIISDNAKELCEGDMLKFYLKMVFYTKELVQKLPNKMELLKESIGTC